MKKVLIISPYFPPCNAADMQRVRMSLPFYQDYGWKAEVVIVNSTCTDIGQDALLLQSIPASIKIHKIKALSKKYTAKIGLGSLALRSLWFYKKYVDQLLKQEHFDLIYFSTTQFPVCILGAHWKNKFGIPYVIDLQDPWHSTYYEDKPINERPKKYWFSYRLNKYLEPLAMKKVDGLISVSQAYLNTMHERYPRTKLIPQKVITFGAFEKDFEIAAVHSLQIKAAINPAQGFKNIAYVGRGGFDMQDATRLLFKVFKELLISNKKAYACFRFHFIGTSYATKGQGVPSFMPIAKEMNLEEYVLEQTDRIGFYESIRTLQAADALVVMGSNDPQYTASKIYPYILAQKPLLGIFNSQSSAYTIINNCSAGIVTALEREEKSKISLFLKGILNNSLIFNPKWDHFKLYGAKSMTHSQCEIFDQMI
ncbi:MAG: glycosyltransferase [Pelobium sp.]